MAFTTDNEHYVETIRNAGLFLLRTAPEPMAGSCFSLFPLGLSLLEMANLFAILATPVRDAGPIHRLFDAGETEGASIDTRLKCIRDLCSSSVYAVRRRRQEHMHTSVQVDWSVNVERAAENEWIELLYPHSAQDNPESVRELARLMNDLLDAAMLIADNLPGFAKFEPLEPWSDVEREICHIRDHFDYAEEFVIDCLRPVEG